MMTFGACSFVFCIGYLIYMKETWKKEKVVTVINENDELVLAKKKSRKAARKSTIEEDFVKSQELSPRT